MGHSAGKRLSRFMVGMYIYDKGKDIKKKNIRIIIFDFQYHVSSKTHSL